MLDETSGRLDRPRRADSVVPRRVYPLPRPGACPAPLILVRSRLKRTHHIGRAVSRSSAVAARRTALAATAAALYYQARDGPSCSPIAARAPPAGRAGLLSQDRLPPLVYVGRPGRALLLSGATSGGRRMRPRVGRLAGRGGAFLVSESCVTRCVRARAALRPFVVWSTAFERESTRRTDAFKLLRFWLATAQRQSSSSCAPWPAKPPIRARCLPLVRLPQLLVSHSR